jgi:hypothetical protein
MAEALRGEAFLEHARNCFEDARKEETGIADSHPSLSDRLAAVKQEARLPGPLSVTASDHFFGRKMQDLIAYFDEQWKKAARQNWIDRHERTVSCKQKLADFETKVAKEPLTEDQLWERATLAEEFCGEEAALPMFQACLRLNPMHVSANYAAGRILIQRQDESGIPMLERAFERAPQCTESACALIQGFLQRQGKTEEAGKYEQKVQEWNELRKKADEERALLDSRTRLLPHELGEESLARQRELLLGFYQVSSAYLVRLEMKYLPDDPLYFVGVEWRGWIPILSTTRVLRRIADRFPFPKGKWWVVSLAANPFYRKSLRKIEGSLIYRRPWFHTSRKIWNWLKPSSPKE